VKRVSVCSKFGARGKPAKQCPLEKGERKVGKSNKRGKNQLNSIIYERPSHHFYQTY
jgi:hypothetical protein